MSKQNRQRVSTGSPYEPRIGISRAVRVGAFVAVAGTAPIGADGKAVAPGDVAAQTHRCLEIIQQALEECGASLADVVRTRLLLVEIEDWEKAAEVHGKFFGNVRPVSTIMQVTRFIDPAWLVEVEADAVVDL